MDYIKDLRKLIGPQPIIMCGANVILVNNREQILMHHRTDHDVWGLPGGAMELNETLEDAAKREVYEEINLKCHSLKLFNLYSGPDFYHKYPDGNEVFNVTATYICRSYEGDIIVEETEGRDAKFFDLDQLPDNISGPVQPIITDYLTHRKWRD